MVSRGNFFNFFEALTKFLEVFYKARRSTERFFSKFNDQFNDSRTFERLQFEANNSLFTKFMTFFKRFIIRWQ